MVSPTLSLSFFFFNTELPEDGKTHKSFSMYCQWHIHEKKKITYFSCKREFCKCLSHPSVDPKSVVRTKMKILSSFTHPHKKICSTKVRESYWLGKTRWWANADRIIHFGWTISLRIWKVWKVKVNNLYCFVFVL